jgi:hypothetical protein
LRVIMRLIFFIVFLLAVYPAVANKNFSMFTQIA